MLSEGSVVPRLNGPKGADFGRPLLIRSMELIREIEAETGRVTDDPERLSLLLWSGVHGVVSSRISEPTFPWPRHTNSPNNLHALQSGRRPQSLTKGTHDIRFTEDFG